MALKGIEHFSSQENKVSLNNEDGIMLRRCNFERFITPRWETSEERTRNSVGERLLVENVLLGIEENTSKKMNS